MSHALQRYLLKAYIYNLKFIRNMTVPGVKQQCIFSVLNDPPTRFESSNRISRRFYSIQSWKIFARTSEGKRRRQI